MQLQTIRTLMYLSEGNQRTQRYDVLRNKGQQSRAAPWWRRAARGLATLHVAVASHPLLHHGGGDALAC